MVADENPAKISRYEIRGELGRGAMGVVYRAWDPTLDRHVALKAIRIGEAVSAEELAEFEQRFLTEARAAARLSHPGIVVVHDVGRDPDSGTLFMALEHVEGETLSQVIARDAPLPWQEALGIAAGVARALHHAHSRGIVHRDVKPANVMRLPTGETKVMDFGIAKLQAAHAQLTSTGQFFGTPLYMSPEQALGETLDGRSDLFSLGVVTYQLLTGRKLFEADSVPRIMTKVAYEPARPPSEANPSVPGAVDAVLMTLLAKAPGERYPDGQTLATDLDRVAAGEAPLAAAPAPVGESTAVSPRAAAPPHPERTATLSRARPAPPPARAPAPSGRSRRGMLAAAGLFAAGVATALLFARGWGLPGGGGGPVARATPTPAPDATPEPPPTPAPTDAPTVAPPPAEAPPEPDPSLATLVVDFQHHYRSGRIRVWVDRQPVMDQGLGGRVQAEVAGLEFRRGYVGQTIAVAPGRREVTVQVDWDDNSRFDTIVGEFREGASRRLEIRIDRFIRRMSLRWR